VLLKSSKKLAHGVSYSRTSLILTEHALSSICKSCLSDAAVISDENLCELTLRYCNGLFCSVRKGTR